MVFVQIVIGVIMVLGCFVLIARAQSESPLAGKSRQAVTSQGVKVMSREDIQRALRKLETSAPAPEKMGAMCYKVAMPAQHLEYVCPLDGEKTIYSGEVKSYWYGQVSEVPVNRELLKKLRSVVRGIAFSLDERKLCSKCFPGLSDGDRKTALVVQYSDGTIIRTEGITSQDIRYLIGFFTDEVSYHTSNDGQLPLKPVAARLKELLGEKGARK